MYLPTWLHSKPRGRRRLWPGILGSEPVPAWSDVGERIFCAPDDTARLLWQRVKGWILRRYRERKVRKWQRRVLAK